MMQAFTVRCCAAALVSSLALCAGCADDATHADPPDATKAALKRRAYVVSERSDDLFVIDLDTLTKVGQIDIGVGGGNANHMVALAADARKVFITAADQNAVVVVDAESLAVTNVIEVGYHDTHCNVCLGCGDRGQDELWVVNEGGNGHPSSVSVIDVERETVTDTIEHESLVGPHFVRFSEGHAYIPNIGGNQISIVDMKTHRVSDVLLTGGAEQTGACSADPCGFADAQIDRNGTLFAAHIESGDVLVYDTLAGQRLADVPMGFQPWAVFVDTLSDDFGTALMPNWGDATVSVMDGAALREIARSPEGDQQSYGINFSPMAPGQAFVLNRIKKQVAVIDRMTGKLVERLDVGGTTETASTTSDGRHLLLPVSSANELSIIDMQTREEIERFENVGQYPWSVATWGGQNYCH
ncbi:MAG: YncE family protein [Myxococcales bacterium]|nr:YncE family protein [Myxococcales bacterium]